MSTLPGGPAAKEGQNHEAVWGVYGMLQVLNGDAERIRIEEPGVDGAEFYLEKRGKREYWQAKRQILSQENWSLNKLGSENVLQFFLEKAKRDDCCVFASISEAPDLGRLCEDARGAQDWSEFEKEFLGKGKDRKKGFDELHRLLGVSSQEETFEFLRRVRVEGARGSTMEALLLPCVRALFTGVPRTVLVVLKDLYNTGIHKTFSGEDLRGVLEREHGIKVRRGLWSDDVRSIVSGLTDRYLAGQKCRLIRGESIPRREAKELLDELLESESSKDVMITGAAGTGKSGVMHQIVEGLKNAGALVLAFRLDRVEVVLSTKALGEQMGLSESPAVVLAEGSVKGPVVLVIDQLDFVSSTAGRRPEFFEVVAAIAEEVRGLRELGQKIHLVTACRKFDFDTDARIRRLLPANVSPITVGLLSVADVRKVVEAEGGEMGRLSERQVELLRLPQNLSLFVEGEIGRELLPSFVSQKELFDCYWDDKKQGLESRCPGCSEKWLGIIECVIHSMSENQELSVGKARLDAFGSKVLAQMVSEGVLTFDGSRYGFGHESFFDYCYARGVARGDGEFVDFLQTDPQELFRRSQLRQVLVFLREDEFSRYIRNVEGILWSAEIRPHLKILTLQILGAVSDPRVEELNLLLPVIERYLMGREDGLDVPDWMVARVWDMFFRADGLFKVADEMGKVEEWLVSGDGGMEDKMVRYLTHHSRIHGDRVAELLERFVESGGDWNLRFRFLIQWTQFGESRKLFELFLRLLKKGALDDARGPIAINSTFWSMLHGLGKTKPAWCAEVAAEWLDRRVEIHRAKEPTAGEGSFRLDDESGINDLFDAARGAPLEFLKLVIPAMLRCAEKFRDRRDEWREFDSVWPYLWEDRAFNMTNAYALACREAFSAAAEESEESLREVCEGLRGRDLRLASNLLWFAYMAAPRIYGEEAVEGLLEKPDLMENDHWHLAGDVIAKCSPYCSQEKFAAIEGFLLDYVTEFERSIDGRRWRGRKAYTLASRLERTRCSGTMQKRLGEWERRFPGEDGSERRGCRVYTVKSPIPEEAAKRMSDEDWLRALKKYEGRDRFSSGNPEKGGADELGSVLGGCAKEEPGRFARLALRLPDSLFISYFGYLVGGVEKGKIPVAVRRSLFERARSFPERGVVMEMIDLLGSFEGDALNEEEAGFLCDKAVLDPDPAQGQAREDGDFLFEGMNCVRGRAFLAIRRLIEGSELNLPVFRSSIEAGSRDKHLGVRGCAAMAVFAGGRYDESWAVDTMLEIVNTESLLVKVPEVFHLVRWSLDRYGNRARPVVESLLESSSGDVREKGGVLAAIGRLLHPEWNDVLEAGMEKSWECRKGVADVASHNVGAEEWKDWCEGMLNRLFGDSQGEVRSEASRCFLRLRENPELDLGCYNGLIEAFLGSRSFKEDPTWLLHALEETRQSVPVVVTRVCRKFVEQCADKARDIRTSIAADERTVGLLAFRAYAQSKGAAREDVLDLINELCSEGLESVGRLLETVER